MRIHKKRFLIVASILCMLMMAFAGVYWVKLRGGKQASTIEASAKRYLEAGEYGSAVIEFDKLLKLKPKDAKIHYLKGLALLEKRDPSRMGVTADPKGIEAMQSFIQATRIDDKMVEAHQILMLFFLGTGDLREAGIHASKVLDTKSDEEEAHYVLAASLMDVNKAEEAKSHIHALLDKQKDARPRTAWLAAQLGDMEGRKGDLTAKVASLLDSYSKQRDKWTDAQDRLALVELFAWRARHSINDKDIESGLGSGIEELKLIVKDTELTWMSPHMLLKVANRLLPDQQSQAANVVPIAQKLKPRVDEIVDTIYQRSVQGQSLDASLYVDYANRLRSTNRAAEAIAMLLKGIEMGRTTDPIIRQRFLACDLWIAEHYVTDKQWDKAKPHIDALIANESSKGIGNLFRGLEAIQQNNWEVASRHMTEAMSALPEHATVNALFGLTQLRRGFITEGRQSLEKAIRLGANEPRYKAWLAMALADAGYRDQAIVLAQQAMADPNSRVMALTILGQLRLRSGDLAGAQQDLNRAVEEADPASRANLKLLQAELCLNQNQLDQALTLLETLKKDQPTSAQAYAMHYRHLAMVKKNLVEANKVLDEGRAKNPEDAMLLALQIKRDRENREFAKCVATLKAYHKQYPKQPAAVIMLAEVYEESRDPTNAVAVLDEAVREFPNQPEFRVRLAERMIKQKKFDEAGKIIAELKGQAGVRQSAVDALMALAALTQGDEVKGDQILKEAAARDPDDATIRIMLAQRATQKGDFNQAREKIERVYLSGANQSQASSLLFDVLIRTSQTDKALELLSVAKQRGQQTSAMQERLMKLLARTEQFEVLQKSIDDMLRNSPTPDEISLAIGLIRYMKKPDEAQKLLDQAIAKYPDSEPLLEHKAALLIEQKKYAESDSLLTNLLKKNPENSTFHVLKIYSLVSRDQFTAAETAALDGWKASPGNQALAALVVQTKIQAGKAAEAVAFANEASNKYREIPSPKYMVSRVHEALGQRDKAIEMLEQHLKDQPKDALAAQHYLRMRINEGRTAGLGVVIEKLQADNPTNPTLLGVLVEYYTGVNELTKAESALFQLLAIQPTGVVSEYSKAIVAAAKRDWVTAEKSLAIAIADPAGHLPSHLLLARILASQGHFEKAIDTVGQALRQDPKLSTAHALRIDLLTQTGKLDQAEEACRNFLKENPNSNSFSLLLARVLSKRSQEDRRVEGIKIADRLLSSGLEIPSEVETCCSILLTAGKKAQVVAYLEKQIATGNKPELVLAAARACLLNGDPENSSKYANWIVQKDETNVRARLLYADSLSQLAKGPGDITGQRAAADQYREVLRRSGGHLLAANNLAWIIGVQLDQPREALAEILEAVPLAKTPHPELPVEIIDTVGTLHVKLDHLEEAKEFLHAAISRDPKNASSHYHLGVLYLRQDRKEMANQYFQKVLDLAPNSEWAGRVKQGRFAN